MGVISYIGDGLRNLVANLGTSRDKAASSYYGHACLTDPELDNAYRSAWLPRKIVDIPAMDSCRNWRTWSAGSDEISEIEAEEKRLGLAVKVLSAMVKARLFGGAGIYIATGDSNPEKELKPESVKKGGIKQLVVLTKRVLTAGELETNPESEQYGRPKYYTITSSTGQAQIHPSRVVRFVGNEIPDPELATGAAHGWGDSVLQSVFEAVRNADATSANIASLVFEAKIDVLQIPNLMDKLAGDPEFEKQLLDRLTLAATAKGINGTLVLDKEEEYTQKQASFASLPDLINSFLQLVSGAADIPMTRLLGQSPAGMNSTGESDIRNYYDRIRSMQELELTPAMSILDECLIRSALGTRPPEVFYNWRSLWQTTDKERADIGKTTAETIEIIDKTGLIPDDVLSLVAQNMLIEAGVAPGLESAMDDYTAANPDEEDDQEEGTASLNSVQADDPEQIADALPRTLYVHRKVKNAQEIIAWARSQGFKTTLAPDDLHVTVAFSRQPVDWMKVEDTWASEKDGSLHVRPGGARLVEKFDGGAVVLMFTSSELSYRHRCILESGATWDYDDYQPHVTITYDATGVDLSKVEPFRGAIELGPEVFEELDEGWKARISEE